MPPPSHAVCASSGFGTQPFTDIVNTLGRAFMSQCGTSMPPPSGPFQPHRATGEIAPTVNVLGPFNRKRSRVSVGSDSSQAVVELDEACAPTEDSAKGEDELSEVEADLGKSRKAVAATSGSDPREMKPAAAAKRTAAEAGLGEAATIANRPAAASNAKRPRGACGSVCHEDWIADNLDNEEAQGEHGREHFRRMIYN